MDTSVMRKDPRREKASLRAVERLAKGGKLRFSISEISRREFLTQQSGQMLTSLKEISTNAAAINRNSAHASVSAFNTSVMEATEKLRQEAISVVTNEFDDWMASINGNILPIAPDHGPRVMDYYFEGHPPFKTIKSRADIPDAFIWVALEDLTKSGEDLHFACADNALGQISKSLQITLYDSLEEFVQRPECQKALSDLTAENVKDNATRAVEVLRSDPQILRDEFESLVISFLDGKEVKGRSIPDDNNEGIVISVDVPKAIKFEFDEAEYYGGTEFGIPFMATIPCTLNYAIFKSDYYLLSDEKAAQISIDERNDHYYDADEEYDIDITGRLLVSMEAASLVERLDVEDLKAELEVAAFELEADDISVEGGAEF